MADLSDLATDLRSVVETWEDDPERLEEIRARRQMLHELERKYGADLDEVAGLRRRRPGAAGRPSSVEERRAAALDEEIAAARAVLEAAEAEVAAARREAAPRLAGRDPGHPARAWPCPRPGSPSTVDGDGPADQVAFLLGANPGEPLQPLAKAASGGELARTMLAIRLAITDSPGRHGLRRSRRRGRRRGGHRGRAPPWPSSGDHAQVLVVTHLAQVAAQADHQVEVRKSEASGRTRSEVAVLDTDGRVVELSRMLSGSPDSASARRHARELLERATRPRSSPS